jgi:hypothetical protein
MCIGDLLTDSSEKRATVTDVATHQSVQVSNVVAPTRAGLTAITALGTANDNAGFWHLGQHATPGIVVDDYHAHRSTTFYYGTGSTIKGSLRSSTASRCTTTALTTR